MNSSDEKLICNRFIEAANNCYNRNIPIATDFLDLHKQTLFNSIMKSLPPVHHLVMGGYDLAERKIIQFLPYEDYKTDLPYSIIKISPVHDKFCENLTHRDYLGAILNLGIARERVALRGSEVMSNIEFTQEGVKKDSLLVTPIGICLNFYEQKNNFIQVVINGEHIKLYDNDKVTVMDAALQLGLANDYLFPKRGDEIVYTVNGEKRMVRGEAGEPAVIYLNGRESNLNAAIEANDKIVIEESTKGAAAKCNVQSLPEYSADINFYVNGNEIVCPRYVPLS